MADEVNPKELPIPHVEVPGFRTIFANGALFSSPADPARAWQLTFYSEGTKIVSETLGPGEAEGTWRHYDPPKIETQRIRRDEVCIIISENQLRGLFKSLAIAMKETEE